MVTVGVLARFEVKPGREKEVAAFFAEGLPLVPRTQTPCSAGWTGWTQIP